MVLLSGFILMFEIYIEYISKRYKNKINFGISVYSDPDPTYAEFNWLNNFAS